MKKKFRIIDLQNNSPLTIVASINYIKKIKDKNGNTMALLTISDSSGEIDVFVFHEDFTRIKDIEYFTVVEAKINYNSQRKMYNWVKLLRRDLNE